MKKLITVFVCLIVLGVTTNSFAKPGISNVNSQITMFLLNQNAKQLTNFNSNPPFPAYVLAYSWSGDNFYFYFVYATSSTDYTTVPGDLGFEITGTINLGGTIYSYGPYAGGNLSFVNGIYSGDDPNGPINNINVTAVSPSTYNGSAILLDDLGPNYNP
jgi:hypothetical protein